MAAGTVASVLKLGLKISKNSSGTMKGLFKSSKKFDKSVKKGLRIKQRLRIAEMKYMKRRREKKKREEEEAQLEQQKSQRKTPTNRVKAAGKTLLERLISLVQILVVGFIVNKLPQIIETIKNVIKTIRNIVDKFKAFFDGVVGFFKSIGKVVGNVFNFIKSIDLGGLKDRMQESLGGLRDALGDLTGGFLDGVKSVLGIGKKEEQEFADEETDNTEDDKLKTSVGDAQKTLMAQTNSFNDSLETIKKEGTGAGIIGAENSNLLDQIDGSSMEDGDGVKKKDKTDGNMKPDPSSTKSVDDVNKPESGGTSDVKQNPPKAQIGDKLNISKPKNKVTTSSITPERKPKNTVMIIGNKGGQSQPQSVTRSNGGTNIIVQKDNSIKDQFALSLF